MKINPLKRLAQWYIKCGSPRLANPFKRTVSIVYTSEWLHGNYVFTFKAGQRDLRTKMIDAMIGNMPDSSAGTYAHAREYPHIEIVDIY